MGMIRIIAGSARRTQLEVPDGDAVRPTADRTREALFSHLGNLAGKRVVDLFAGSGALGLEAASRGAENVVLIEKNPRHATVLAENIERVRRAGCPAALRVEKGDAADFFRWPAGCDLILADPPYDASADYFQQIVRNPAFRRRAANARLLWEIPGEAGEAGRFMLENPPFQSVEFRPFGGTLFLSAVVLPEEEA